MSRGDSACALVTGGAGFIGSHLVEALVLAGTNVIVADDLSAGNAVNLAAVADAIELHRLDLTRDDLAPVMRGREPDTLFHLAGSVDVPGSVAHPRRDLERNVLTTLNVLQAIRAESPDTRLVNGSTAAVYGAPGPRPWREEDPTRPLSPYGVSKLAAERYASIAAPLYGLQTASIRLFHVYGPRLRRQVVYDLMRKLTTGDDLVLEGDPEQVIDLNAVANVVDALRLVASAAPLEGEVYNVASGRSVTIGELARLVCRGMGCEPRVHSGSSVRAEQPPSFRGDISRLERLGYAARVGLEQGLAETIEWFRNEVAGVAATDR